MTDHVARPDQSAFVRAALSLVTQGFHVFPCAQDKSPLTPHGYKDATLSPEILQYWGVDHPEAAIAIACAPSGLVVIDIDDEAAWAEHLSSRGLTVPSTREARTAGGGRHLYFRASPGVRYPGKLCDGVDVKHNGYVLAPPASAWSKRTEAVGEYVWINETQPIAQAPDWLGTSPAVHAPGTASVKASNARGGSHRAALQPGSETSPEELCELLSYIDPDVPYPDWCAVLMAVHAASDGSTAGLDLADTWSSGGSKYRPGEVNKKWATFASGNGVGSGTLAKLARDGGADLNAISRRHSSASRSAAPSVMACKMDGDVFCFGDLDLSGVKTCTWEGPGANPCGCALCLYHLGDPETVAAVHGFVPPDPWDHVPLDLPQRDAVIRKATELNKRVYSAAEAKPVLSSNDLVEGLLQRKSSAFLYGPSGLGKTFVALRIGIDVAEGAAWAGRKTHRGTVVYLNSEGAGSFSNRVRAVADVPSDALIVVPGCIDLYASEIDVRALMAVIEKRVGSLSDVELVIIDTLAQNMGSAEENSATDMSTVSRNLERLKEALDTTVLAVHHTGKDASRGLRGSSSIYAAADTVLELSAQGSAIRLESVKQRDLAGGDMFMVTLEDIEIGNTPEGTPVMSCRASVTDVSGAAAAPKLSREQARVLEILDEVHGCDSLPLEGMPPRRLVPTKDLLDGIVKDLCDDEDSSKRRPKANRWLKQLVDKGLLACDDTGYWKTEV